jgi:hypothetical protein
MLLSRKSHRLVWGLAAAGTKLSAASILLYGSGANRIINQPPWVEGRADA